MLYEKLLPVAKGNPAATNPPFNKVALLLHGDGTNGTQNNSFLDSSVPSTYPGGYGVSFDGNGDYLSVPDNTGFDFGTGDFTIECWVNFNSTSSVQTLVGHYLNSTTGWSLQWRSDSGRWSFANGDTPLITYTNTPTIGRWYHYCICRSGTTLRMFLDGTQASSATNSTNIAGSTNTLTIGALNGTGIGLGILQYTNGFISNLRVVKGTALYTSNFTPSTTPLTLIANTSLLTCQSLAIVDNSTNKFPISVFGNSAVVDTNNFAKRNLSPFATDEGTWSNYFDGSGDWLTIPYNANLTMGNNDFTIELWYYPNSFSSYQLLLTQDDGNNSNQNFQFRTDASGIFSYVFWTTSSRSSALAINSSTALTLNSWNHLAVSYTSTNTTTRLFLNGTQVGSSTSAPWNSSTYGGQTAIGNFTSGISQTAAYAKVNGYISNIRMVKGTAVYTSNFTPSTVPLTAVSGTQLLTCQSNRFKDNSSNNFTLTPAGNVATNVFSPFSSYTAYSGLAPGGGGWFNGTNDYFSAPDSASLQVLGSSFTIECWFYLTSTSPADMGLISKYDAGGAGYILRLLSTGTGIRWYAGTGGQVLMDRTYAFALNTWYHVAVTCNGTNTAIFVNGVKQGASGGVSSNNSTATFQVGLTHTVTNYFPGYISNVRVVKGSAVYDPASSNITIPTAPLAPIPNTQLLTCQSIYPVDDSPNELVITANGTTYATNPNQITRYGNVAQGTFSPFSQSPGYWSNYFGGDGYLSWPYSAASYDWYTSNFTIECWVYPTSTTGWDYGYVQATMVGSMDVNGNMSWIFGFAWGGALAFQYRDTGGNVVFIRGGSFPALNTWTHIAMCNVGGQVTLYKNGTSVATAATGNNGVTGAYNMQLGRFGSAQINGYISNLRIVKGTAVYTGNFTPPTAPLTAITNTTLLTSQSNRFVDNSSVNATISSSNAPKVTAWSPFVPTAAYSASTNGGSGYFDGSGDYLVTGSSITLSGDFTIEAFLYVTSLSANRAIVQIGDDISSTGPLFYISTAGKLNCYAGAAIFTGTATIPTNAWIHVAIVRSGTTAKSYVNGILDVTAPSFTANPTGTVKVGAEWYNGTIGATQMLGYISNVRITTTAVYTANFTPPTAPLTAVTSTQLLLNCTNAGIYDNAAKNDIETVGNAMISTLVKKYGTGSMYFDGNGDYLVSPTSDVFNFGTGDFTVEGWINTSSLASEQAIFDCLPIGGAGSRAAAFVLVVATTGSLRYFSNGAYSGSTTNTITTGSWFHFAMVRASGVVKIYINGTQGLSVSNTTAFTASCCVIGRYSDTAGGYLNGYIDDLRITKGVAVYTSNFTPPTQAFPNV